MKVTPTDEASCNSWIGDLAQWGEFATQESITEESKDKGFVAKSPRWSSRLGVFSSLVSGVWCSHPMEKSGGVFATDESRLDGHA